MTKSKRFNFKLKRNFYKALMLLARRDYNLSLLGGDMKPLILNMKKSQIIMEILNIL